MFDSIVKGNPTDILSWLDYSCAFRGAVKFCKIDIEEDDAPDNILVVSDARLFWISQPLRIQVRAGNSLGHISPFPRWGSESIRDGSSGFRLR
jgi:hypothetical protein